MTTSVSPGIDETVENSSVATEADSVIDLKKRLNAELTASMEQIQSLRDDAANSFFGNEKNLICFKRVVDQVHSILVPRLQALTDLDALAGSRIHCSPDEQEQDVKNFHSQSTTFTPPFGYRCPAKVQLSFHLRHDHQIENAILEFQLEIIPVFVRFDKKDELSLPFDDPNEEEIGAWIDEKLIGFTRTLFEITFHDEYQKRHRVTDPVMKIQFPRAFAFADRTHENSKFYFYTQESMNRFELSPTDYVPSM